MSKVLVRVNVAYPAHLILELQRFDRKRFGELSYLAEQDDDIHNLVYVTFTWDTLAKAREFWRSQDGTEHVASWHSIGKPEFVFLRTLPHELLS